MIRVYKSSTVPESLSTHKSYNKEEVYKQLRLDQHKKCYICERKCITDYQIEHWHSQDNFQDEITNWDNLFLACGYCNGLKSNNYDDIVNPTETNIEEVISQKIDYEHKRAVFKLVQEKDSLKRTVELLLRIYNGKQNIRKSREESFFEYFMSEMNKFRRAILEYKIDSNTMNTNIVIELLNIKQEFLGFKFWIIMDDEKLSQVFLPYCKWNKIG